MAHSFRSHFFHVIWSTKDRNNWIEDEMEPRLFNYIGGIVRQHGSELLSIGGTSNHVHLLINSNTPNDFFSLIRNIKAGSSRFIHQNYPELQKFAWQEGYGSFSISYSTLGNVKKYILNQKEHHKTVSFEKEFLRILELNQIQFDNRFVLG